MKRFFWAALLGALGCLCGGSAVAASLDLTLRLPAGVQRLRNGYDDGDPLHYNIALSPSARDRAILLPPGSAFDAEKCVIAIRVTADTQVSFLASAAADSRIALEIVGSLASRVTSPPSSTSPGSTSLSSTSTGTTSTPPRITPPEASADAVVTGASTPAAPQPVAAGKAKPASPSPAVVQSLTTALFPDVKGVDFDPAAKADFAVPASAAATAIGASSTLVRAATPRELVTGLLSDFDQEGRLQSGFSMAFVPYTLFRGEPVTADDYNEHRLTRFLARLQVSLAGREDATIVTADKKAVRYGLGLTAVFFDEGDLRTNNALLRSIAQALHKDIPDADLLKFDPAKKPFSTDELKGARKLWDAAKAENWNASSAGLGVSPTFLSLTGKLADAKSDGLMAWVSYAGRPSARSTEHRTVQWLLGGNGHFHHQVLTNGVWNRQDSLSFGGQLRYGGEAGNLFAEAQYRRRSGAGLVTTSKFVYEVGLERRLSEGLWLNLSWTNDDEIKGGNTLRSGLRYGFGNKAVLQNPGQ